MKITTDQAGRASEQSQRTGHDLEQLEATTLVLGYSLVGLLLLVRGPALNVVQDVDAGGVVGPGSEVFLLAKDGPVHGGEIDDGDREGAVHVEDDAPQASPSGEIGHE